VPNEVLLNQPAEPRTSTPVFTGSWFLYNFSYWMIMSYVPVHLQALGLSDTEIGYCVGTPQLMTLFMVLPFGTLSDRLPARRLSQIGIALMMVWAVMLGFSDARWVAFAAFAFAGVGMPLHLVSFNALFLKNLGGTAKGGKVGGFVMAQFMGFALGPMATPIVQSLAASRGLDPSVAFLAAGFCFAGALGLTFLLHDPARMPFHLSEYVGDVRSKRGMLVTAIIFLFALHFGAEQTFYPAFLRDQCGLSQYGVGTVYAYSGILIGIVAVFMGRAFDKRRTLFSIMALAMVFSGVFQALTGLCDTLWEVLGVRTLHTMADGALNCYLTLFVAVTFPAHRVGGNFGFVLAVRTVGILVAATASGHLVDLGGLPAPFYASGIACALGGLTFLAFRPKLKQVMGETKSYGAA
jgi:MFS family permease